CPRRSCRLRGSGSRSDWGPAWPANPAVCTARNSWRSLAVLLEPRRELALERFEILRARTPIHVQRLDLGAQEMVRTGCAHFGQPGGVMAVHKTQDDGVSLNGGDETLLAGKLAAKPGQQLVEQLVAPGGRERLMLLAAERLLSLIAVVDIN